MRSPCRPALTPSLRAGPRTLALRTSDCLADRRGNVVALTPDEIDLIQRMRNLLANRERDDIKHLRYREGEARVEHLGMAIPPNMRNFMVFVSWCDTLV